jgi:hypothetical protein
MKNLILFEQNAGKVVLSKTVLSKIRHEPPLPPPPEVLRDERMD